jgi:hypothetical protein
MWTKDEENALWAEALEGEHGRASVLRIASRAASLLTARSGSGYGDFTAMKARLAIASADLAAQGAEVTTLREKVAALEAELREARQTAQANANRTRDVLIERDALCEKVAGLEAELTQEKASCSVWRQRCETAAGVLSDVSAGGLGRLDLVGRIRRDALRAELARLKPSGQVAEDVKGLEDTINYWTTYSLDETRQADLAALSRLAALAQQGQAIRERAEQQRSEFNHSDVKNLINWILTGVNGGNTNAP